jgi:hypothetical protein
VPVGVGENHDTRKAAAIPASCSGPLSREQVAGGLVIIDRILACRRPHASVGLKKSLLAARIQLSGVAGENGDAPHNITDIVVLAPILAISLLDTTASARWHRNIIREPRD